MYKEAGYKDKIETEPGELASVLHIVAEKQNKDLGAILNTEGRIKMDQFIVNEGGPYKKEDVKSDKKFMAEKELEWSGLDNEKMRQYYIDKYNIKIEGRDIKEVNNDLLSHWHENQFEHDGPRAEAVLTILLQKVIGEQFYILRTAEIDDYKNGVDHLILDKEGNVVCTFDEVTDEAIGARTTQKHIKVLDKAKQGGATIKYGASFKDGKLIKQPIEHVPMFALSISKTELAELSAEVVAYGASGVGAGELAMFDKLYNSLQEQVTEVERIDFSSSIKERLDSFKDSLVRMRDLRNKFNKQ